MYLTYTTLFSCSRIVKKFFNLNSDQIQYTSVNPSNTPWLWVGAELTNGKIVTVTDTLNKHIQYGDVVTIEYLESVTRVDKNVLRWLYLNSKTLNEQEFPPEGLVIQDDSNGSNSS